MAGGAIVGESRRHMARVGGFREVREVATGAIGGNA